MLLYAIILCLNLFMLALIVLPYLKHQGWWIRMFDFPRLQSFTFGCILLVIELLVLDFSRAESWGIISLTIVFFCVQGWWILPFSPLKKVEVEMLEGAEGASVERQGRISVLNANVLTPNRNAQALLELIARYQPDVVITLESDQWWQQQLDAIEVNYPYSLKCPLDNLYGMHVYSKIKFSQSKLTYLIEEGVPSMHFILPMSEQTNVRLHVLHPAPPSPTENETSQERDAELIQVAKYCREQQQRHDLPVIVAGDLNDVAWSRSTRLFRKISGLLDPRVGRGMFNTFHAKYWPVRWPLDHFFISAHFKLLRMERLPTIGSDHFPIFIELAFQPNASEEQQGLVADADDRAWAEEKLDKVTNDQ